MLFTYRKLIRREKKGVGADPRQLRDKVLCWKASK